MTSTASVNGARPVVDDDPRADAVQLWLAVRGADGERLTGRELGDRFGMSPRWGRDRIADARELAATADPSPDSAVWLHRVRVAAAAVVALVAAAVSFDHQRALAVATGEGWRSWILPLSVDGMLVVTSVTALERRRLGQPLGVVPVISGILGVGVSIAANVAAVTDVDPNAWAPWVAAWAPVALLLSVEMLLSSHRPQSGS